jgi:hypothetical protein
VRARIFADENRKWWTLGALAFALFMIMLDSKNSDLTSGWLEQDPSPGGAGHLRGSDYRAPDVAVSE